MSPLSIWLKRFIAGCLTCEVAHGGEARARACSKIRSLPTDGREAVVIMQSGHDFSALAHRKSKERGVAHGKQRGSRTGKMTSDEDHSPAFLRRFFALAVPFFTSEERWMARLLIGVLALTMLQIGIAIRLNSVEPGFLQRARKPRLERLHLPDGLFALLCAAARWASRSTRSMSSSCCSCAGAAG